MTVSSTTRCRGEAARLFVLSLRRSNPVPSRSARLQSELFFEKGGRCSYRERERDAY